MKKLIVLFLCCIGSQYHAQEVSATKDSARMYKNEIGVNFLPLIDMFEFGGGIYSKQNINYRRYISGKSALRFSIGYFSVQSEDITRSQLTYDRKIDTFLVFNGYQFKSDPKPHFSIGYEYLFKKGIVIQSVGADAFMNYQHTETRQHYYAVGQSSDINFSIDKLPSMDTRVDSLSSGSSSDILSFGINIFYNLRIPIGKHWNLSGTIGPWLSVNTNKETYTEYSPVNTQKRKYSNFDIQSIILSDISIAYRF